MSTDHVHSNVGDDGIESGSMTLIIMSCKHEPYYSTNALKIASITNFLTHSNNDVIVNATIQQ